MLTAINPTDGNIIKTYVEPSSTEVVRRLDAAGEVFHAWKKTDIDERAGFLKNAARILTGNKEQYARLMAAEMGKPIRQGRDEIEKCAWGCEFYSDQAAAMLQPQSIETDADRSFISFKPLGVILAIMPWNYPFWQAFRCAAPGLMAGNVMVLKHAANVPGCALAIEAVFKKAGFPENLFQSILIPSRRVTELIAHPLIRAVSLTGSKSAGRAVAAEAGKLIKKSVLELGGSDPYIILEDADLEKTVATCVESRLLNSGQSCIAAKRFIVVESVHKRFEEMLVEQMRGKKMGSPLDETVDVGPQARFDLR
jgi:succinate-semialdehyde dehydrogenase/glutarate-semialdehyde dehydrogenase